MACSLEFACQNRVDGTLKPPIPDNSVGVKPQSGRGYKASANSFATRAVTVVIAGCVGLASSRLVIEQYGVQDYGIIFYLATLPALLSFLDAGTGGAVIKAFADAQGEADDGHRWRVMLSSLRVTLVLALVLTLVALSLTALGGWSAILGVQQAEFPGLAQGALLVLVAFALTLPLSLARGTLIGLGRLPLSSWLQAAGAFTGLLTMVVCVKTSAPAWVIPGVLALPSLISVALMMLAAYRICGLPDAAMVRAIHRIHSVRGAPVVATMGSVLIIAVSMPLVLQSSRVIVAHLAPAENLAELAFALLIYAVLAQVIGAGGMALWPIYTRRRQAGDLQYREILVATAAFLGIGALIAVAAAMIAAPLSAVATGGTVTLSEGTLVALGLLLVGYAGYFPAGMFLTTSRGLLMQSGLAVTAAVLSIGLSLLLTPMWGVAGALGACATAAILVRVIGSVLVARSVSRHQTS